jgi:hypothetical protein
MHASAEVHPPLYFYWLHFWLLLGAVADPAINMHEAWLRVSSLLPSLATVAVLWYLVRDAVSGAAATVAACCLALCSFHVVFGEELRMYSLATLWVTLAAWALWRGRFPVYAVAACLALYTHYLTGFYLLALHSILVWHRTMLRPLLLADLAVAAAFAPWVPHVLEQAGSPLLLRQLPAPAWFPELVFQWCVGWTVPVPLAGWPGVFLAPIKWLALAVPVTLAGVLWQRRDATRPAALWSLLTCLTPVLLAVAVTEGTPVRIFEYKYFCMSTPFAAMLLGWAATQAPRPLALGIAIALLGANLYSLGELCFNPAMGWQDWQATAQFVAPRVQPEDTILVQPGMFSAALNYYLAQAGVRSKPLVVPVDTRPDGLPAALTKNGRIWLVDTPAHPEVAQVGLDRWLRDHQVMPVPEDTLQTVNFFPANIIRVGLYATHQVP